jgi:hypothetical protein
MTTKLKVDAKQASELMVQGYEVECYVMLPDPSEPKRKSPSNVAPQVPRSAVLAYAPKGKVPQNGKIAAIWAWLRDSKYKDPRKTYTREDLEKAINAQKFNYKGQTAISQLLHTYHILRKVDGS